MSATENCSELETACDTPKGHLSTSRAVISLKLLSAAFDAFEKSGTLEMSASVSHLTLLKFEQHLASNAMEVHYAGFQPSNRQRSHVHKDAYSLLRFH